MTTLKTPQALRAAFEIKLSESDLDAADAKRLSYEPLTAVEVKALGQPAFAGFRLPYFDIDGKRSKFWRLRYLEDTRSGLAKLTAVKALRYVQPTDSLSEVYLPPWPKHSWRAIAEDAERALLITEGELKAACAIKYGLPTLGLGGVWSFRAAKNNLPILPLFNEFVWTDRPVYIVYDSDAASNPKVVQAESELARTLTNLGAEVNICRLPNIEGRGKTGLDDYLVQLGRAAFERVLDGAIPYAASAALHGFNAEVIYVRDPGIVVAWDTMQKMAPGGFKEHHYGHRFFTITRVDQKGEIKMTEKPLAQEWLKWPHRASTLGLTYSPGADRITPEGYLNTWHGMPIAPEKGDVKPWIALLDHLFQGAEPAARRWFEQWCAYPLQHLGTKMATAAVIWGVAMGSGKTLVGHTLMRIYGKNAGEITDAQLREDRNEWAESKQFILADDITANASRELSNRLNTLITQKFVQLNPKYIPSYSAPALINYLFTSNDPDAFLLSDSDRRFFIHEVKGGMIDEALRRRYVDWRDSDDGIAALYHYLLTLDLTGFDPQAAALRTRAKADMIITSKSELGRFVHDLGREGPVMLNGVELNCELFTSAELLRAFDPSNEKRLTAQGVARELKRSGHRLLRQIKFPEGGGSGVITPFALRNHAAWEAATPQAITEHYRKYHPGGQLALKKF